MRDIDYDPGAKTAYECFDCGTIVVAKSKPGACDNCGSAMRNRLMPIE